MPNPVWPSALPDDQFEGLSAIREPNVIRTPNDVGPAQLRRRSTAAIRPISLLLRLTHTERQTFDSFFITTLVDGVLAFDWTDPVTDVTVTMRFRGYPPFRMKVGSAGRTWQATMELEVLP